MNRMQFQNEKLYYISLSIAKSMLKKDIIDDELFTLIKIALLDKYRPVSTLLIEGKSLT